MHHYAHAGLPVDDCQFEKHEDPTKHESTLFIIKITHKIPETKFKHSDSHVASWNTRNCGEVRHHFYAKMKILLFC